MDCNKNRIPVTLVSGWHGSGKTTLLTQLAKAQEEDKGQRVEMIRMREGDDMLDELRRDIERVVSSGLCKSLVVECGGLHQPMRVADMLRMTDLNDRVALDTCVTVVDATTMMQNIEDARLISVDEDEEEEEGEKEIASEWFLQQIEFANVIVLNKIDKVSSEDAASQLVTLLRSLNPSAKIVQTVQSAVCVEDVVATGMFDYEKTENSAGWAQCMNKSGKVGLFPIGEATDSTASGHGSCAFMYSADKPFHPKRLFEFMTKYFVLRQEEDVEYEQAHGIAPAEVTLSLQEAEKNIKRAIDLVSRGAHKNSKTIHLLNESMKSLQDALVDMSQTTASSSSVPGDFEAFKDAYGTIVRSKGVFWIATRPNLCGEWSQSGAALQCCCSGPWSASPPHGQGGSQGRPRQEIAFIGMEMNAKSLEAELNRCLISDDDDGESTEAMHDPFAAWPSLDSENDDQNNDEEYMPLGKVVQITDGASEAQHILDSIEPGTTAIIYWHAEWHAQGDAILTELRSIIDKVSTLVIHVKIGDHPPNWSFAMEKVMEKPEANRPGAKPVLKQGHSCWPCFTVHTAPSLQPIETISGGRAMNTLRKLISGLPEYTEQQRISKRREHQDHPSEPESSETTTSVWSDVSSAFPYLQNGAVELRELLKNFAKEKKSLYILWEEGGIPLKILKALESITIIRPDTNNLFIATVGASPGNEALAKALGVKKGPSLLVFSNMKVDKKYDGPDKVRDALAQEFRTLPAEATPAFPIKKTTSHPSPSIYDPPQGKQNRSGTTKLTPNGNLVHYFPKMPCLKCGNPWWTSDDWDALCIRCGWNCQTDGYDDDSKPLPKYKEIWATYCASIKAGVTPAWKNKKSAPSTTKRI
ncbi:hypothetical protein M9435_006064 [Picochlorum sp. BPE23]|nr:hypothetical protein M9435_006064 [Picochlorum sp. BPE23]